MFNPQLFAQLESGDGYNKIREKEILNPHVNFHKNTNVQSLQDALISEAIQMRGVETFYIRREFVNLDLIFGEDTQSKFEKAYRVAMYVESFDAYEGQGGFFSKFGMQMEDEIRLQVNPELFKYQADGQRPREGDLIYFPMGNALFELTWVEPNNPFFQSGVSSILSLTATKFVYSGEKLDPKVKVGHGVPPADPASELFDLDLNELTDFERCPGDDDEPEEITRFEYTDELNPVKNLDGIADIKKGDFAEDRQIYIESNEFVDPINYRPVNAPPGIPNKVFDPFDDF